MSEKNVSASSDGEATSPARMKTGVTGLDEILEGGLPANRLYLIEGEPGAGKTTLASAVSHGRRAARRNRSLRHAFRNTGRA
jgi:predicted ATP-dependent serine protease